MLPLQTQGGFIVARQHRCGQLEQSALLPLQERLLLGWLSARPAADNVPQLPPTQLLAAAVQATLHGRVRPLCMHATLLHWHHTIPFRH